MAAASSAEGLQPLVRKVAPLGPDANLFNSKGTDALWYAGKRRSEEKLRESKLAKKVKQEAYKAKAPKNVQITLQNKEITDEEIRKASSKASKQSKMRFKKPQSQKTEDVSAQPLEDDEETMPNTPVDFSALFKLMGTPLPSTAKSQAEAQETKKVVFSHASTFDEMATRLSGTASEHPIELHSPSSPKRTYSHSSTFEEMLLLQQGRGQIPPPPEETKKPSSDGNAPEAPSEKELKPLKASVLAVAAAAGRVKFQEKRHELFRSDCDRLLGYPFAKKKLMWLTYQLRDPQTGLASTTPCMFEAIKHNPAEWKQYFHDKFEDAWHAFRFDYRIEPRSSVPSYLARYDEYLLSEFAVDEIAMRVLEWTVPLSFISVPFDAFRRLFLCILGLVKPRKPSPGRSSKKDWTPDVEDYKTLPGQSKTKTKRIIVHSTAFYIPQIPHSLRSMPPIYALLVERASEVGSTGASHDSLLSSASSKTGDTLTCKLSEATLLRFKTRFSKSQTMAPPFYESTVTNNIPKKLSGLIRVCRTGDTAIGLVTETGEIILIDLSLKTITCFYKKVTAQPSKPNAEQLLRRIVSLL